MTLSLHIFRGSKCGFYHFNRGSPAVVMVYHLYLWIYCRDVAFLSFFFFIREIESVLLDEK